MNWRDFPKIELHLHLEGAAPPALIKQLAFEKKLDISNIFTPDGQYDYRDFWHFLEVYEAATSVLTGPEEFKRLTAAVLEESAAHGVIYTEAFLSPDFCGGRDVGAWREYLHAIREAADEAHAAHGITLRGIITPIRHFGGDVARETARCAQETAGDFITGFGIGGDEKAGHLKDFAYAFDMAREAGLRLTAHAGEWCGPEEVRAALDHLRVARIGHGVRSIEDAALVERLAQEQIVLEVCPGSNVFLGAYPRLAAHPIERLRAEGVKVTVSTDDPPFFRTTMTREYEDLERVFGWDAERFTQVNLVAAEAAFCDDETRAALRDRLETPHV
ncbi:adenosine deaminase [Aliiroseovarius sp.]|uniref:adenosine deaminase n=1 Tax=Aliiroseovarius sp. TaxID=1872442 RepID=UPI002618E1C0|nr:adenosine deaminase [Aliiroseovarius sp.]